MSARPMKIMKAVGINNCHTEIIHPHTTFKTNGCVLFLLKCADNKL